MHAWARSQVARQASAREVTTMVRESHPLGQCSLLGDLIDETCTRYVYRRRFGDTLALVDKRSPTIHVVPARPARTTPSSSADWLRVTGDITVRREAGSGGGDENEGGRMAVASQSAPLSTYWGAKP